MRNAADTRCRENETHVILKTFFSKIVSFMKKYVEKYGRARQATVDNMAYAICLPDI